MTDDQVADRGMCSSCLAAGWWVPTEHGARMLLDLTPLTAAEAAPPARGRVVRTETLLGVAARVLGDHDQVPDGLTAWRAHWSTCPNADQHRKER